jgi:DNA-binding transcriptional MocR family regulator
VEYLDFGHIPTEGYQPLRSHISALANNKGFETSPDDILVVSGSQQGLYLISKVLIEPGDYIILETPTYIGAIQIFEAAGARILCLPNYEDSSEAWFSALEDYLIRYRPKLFYIIPNFQNPTGQILPEIERKRLLELAAQHRLIVVEDDPYGELYYSMTPPLSLKALDNYGGVIYLGTFSKMLFPGLRTGWLIAPPIVVNRLAQEKQYADLHSNNLTQWLLYLFLREGCLETHLAKVRHEYKKRRDTMASSITKFCGNDISFTLPDGGFYLWCKIHRKVTAQTLLHECTKSGLSFVPGEAFYANQAGNYEMRLCYTTHSASILSKGINRLAATLKTIPDDVHNKTFSAFTTGRPII